MIRPLRARHLAIFVLLTLVLVPALAIALASRPRLAAGPLPEALLDHSEDARLTWSSAVKLANAGVSVRQARADDGRRWVELSGKGPRGADVLVYVAARAPADGELPEGARLVGSLGTTSPVPSTIELPPDASGWLVLYSLADGTTLGALQLEE